MSTLCPHFCEYLFQLQFKIISWALKHRFLHWKSLLYIFSHFFTIFFCCIIWCWNSMISINHIKNGGKTCSIIVHYQNTPRIRVKRWWTWTKTFLGVTRLHLQGKVARRSMVWINCNIRVSYLVYQKCCLKKKNNTPRLNGAKITRIKISHCVKNQIRKSIQLTSNNSSSLVQQH